MQVKMLFLCLMAPCFTAFRYEPGKPADPAAGIIYRSTDGGQSWQDISAGLPVYTQVNCVFAGSGAVILGTENGFYRSSAGAKTPDWKNELFPAVAIDDIIPGRDGPFAFGYGGGLFQEKTGTDIWLPLHQNLPDKRLRTVLEMPDGTLFAGCDGGIFKSVDGAKSWKQVFNEGRVGNLVAAGNVLIGSGSRGILRSTDGGDHWDWSITGTGAGVFTALVEGGVAALTFDGTDRLLYTSTDEGLHWQRQGDDLLPLKYLNDVKQMGKYVFCSQEGGVFRSSDQGKHWETVLPAAEHVQFEIAVSGKVIYALKFSGC